jgi:hypothetical protein
MRILDFGPTSGHTIDAFDSRATLASLMGPTDAARAVVVHLPPDGIIGSHDAAAHQLYCVVAGEGWVSGTDDVRHPIRPYQAAEWQAGERHTSGTESGMVVVVLEGDFEVEIPER